MILQAMSWLYGIIIARRNKRFDAKTEEIRKVPATVISVGNISVGGTGKTPFVSMLVLELLSLGAKPAIVSRGYGRKSKGEVIVSDGKRILVNVVESGDELLLNAEKLPIPVIANADRFAGAMTAITKFGANVIVLDDGFQHRQLHRDCDIVLIDSNTLQNSKLLPEGRLREPLSELKRADVVCATGGFSISDLPHEFLSENALKIQTDVVVKEVKNIFSGNNVKLKNERVLAFSALANNSKFRETLIKHKINVSKHLEFRDHIFYDENSIRRMIAECKKTNIFGLITTEKDAVKIRRFQTIFDENSVQVYSLEIELKIANGRQEFLDLIQKIGW